MIDRLSVVTLLFLSTSALASGPVRDLPVEQDTTLERYAHDLVGSDASDRLYAAREILRRVRRAHRLASRDGVEIEILEAKQHLTDFDRMVAPKCIRQLTVQNVRRICATILGLLETNEAITPLESALEAETRRGARRSMVKALERLQPGGETTP